MVAKQFGVEVGTLTKALQRKAEPKPPKAKKAKGTKTALNVLRAF